MRPDIWLAFFDYSLRRKSFLLWYWPRLSSLQGSPFAGLDTYDIVSRVCLGAFLRKPEVNFRSESPSSLIVMFPSVPYSDFSSSRSN